MGFVYKNRSGVFLWVIFLKKPLKNRIAMRFFTGAGNRTWTCTSGTLDPKSSASANSAMPATQHKDITLFCLNCQYKKAALLRSNRKTSILSIKTRLFFHYITFEYSLLPLYFYLTKHFCTLSPGALLLLVKKSTGIIIRLLFLAVIIYSSCCFSVNSYNSHWLSYTD